MFAHNSKPITTNKTKLFFTFLRAQAAAAIATAIDFLVFILLTNVFSVWYVVATAVGAFAGAVVNFLIGRYWVFDSTKRKIQNQAFRYAIVAIGSLLLNTLGVYLVTEHIGLVPLHSKIIVSILVAFGYNFVLQKLFVYR